jgi:hypothetical protein
MGTWGYGPFDSDDAGDMLVKLSKSIERVVNATADTYASECYSEARAAIQILLLAHGTDILGGPGLYYPLMALARMRGDAEWLAGFRHPRKLATLVDNEMAAVLARMRACKGCRQIHDMKDMAEIVGHARAAKVPKSSGPIKISRKPYPPGDSRNRKKKRRT